MKTLIKALTIFLFIMGIAGFVAYRAGLFGPKQHVVSQPDFIEPALLQTADAPAKQESVSLESAPRASTSDSTKKSASDSTSAVDEKEVDQAPKLNDDAPALNSQIIDLQEIRVIEVSPTLMHSSKSMRATTGEDVRYFSSVLDSLRKSPALKVVADTAENQELKLNEQAPQQQNDWKKD